MFRAAALSLALLGALCILPARAQTASASDDSHFAAALDFMDAINAKANMLTMIDALVPLVLNQIRMQHPNANAAVLREFQTAFREEITADMDGLMKASAAVYEQHFTENELRGLTQFYRSELGRKYIETAPILFKESVPIGAAWGREAGMRAAQRALERLHANGVDL